MTSKVLAKLRLGAAFCMLLVSLALLASCQQEAPQPQPEPVVPGILTETTWKSPDGTKTIKFGSDGSVSLDGVDLKSMGIQWLGSGNIAPTNTITNGDWQDLAYSISSGTATITGRLANEGVSGTKDERYTLATFRLGVTEGTSQKTNYYKAAVTFNTANPQSVNYEMDVPKAENFHGTYYNADGKKALEVNSNGTFVTFSQGGKTVRFWKDGGGDGTIKVYPSKLVMESAGSATLGTTYYCYPRLLTSNPSSSSYTYYRK